MSAFVVTDWQGEPSNTAPDEHDDLAWFTANEIADLQLAHPTARAQLQVLANRRLALATTKNWTRY